MSEEKEKIFISQQVLDRFRDELLKLNGNFNKLCGVFLATKNDESGKVISVFKYDDPSKYQKYIESHYLADLDLFFDFTYPINYFKILLSRIKEQ